jgi:hypothetical protein
MYAWRHVCCCRTQDNLLRELNRAFYPLEYKYKKGYIVFLLFLDNVVLKVYTASVSTSALNKIYNLKCFLLRYFICFFRTLNRTQLATWMWREITTRSLNNGRKWNVTMLSLRIVEIRVTVNNIKFLSFTRNVTMLSLCIVKIRVNVKNIKILSVTQNVTVLSLCIVEIRVTVNNIKILSVTQNVTMFSLCIVEIRVTVNNTKILSLHKM